MFALMLRIRDSIYEMMIPWWWNTNQHVKEIHGQAQGHGNNRGILPPMCPSIED